jgi:hypothetical protein
MKQALIFKEPDSILGTSPGKVNIQTIKAIVRGLPPHSALRATILAEDDELTPEEYLFKLKVWLRLLKDSADLR